MRTVIVLAAGVGKRMKSDLPKVAHRILDVPMAGHVIDAARTAGAARIVVVTGHGAEAVEAVLAGAGVEFALQAEQLGTGHAVMAAAGVLADATGSLLIMTRPRSKGLAQDSNPWPMVTASEMTRSG